MLSPMWPLQGPDQVSRSLGGREVTVPESVQDLGSGPRLATAQPWEPRLWLHGPSLSWFPWSKKQGELCPLPHSGTGSRLSDHQSRGSVCDLGQGSC